VSTWWTGVRELADDGIAAQSMSQSPSGRSRGAAAAGRGMDGGVGDLVDERRGVRAQAVAEARGGRRARVPLSNRVNVPLQEWRASCCPPKSP